MVRLKVSEILFLRAIFAKFQFHYGSIKSPDFACADCRCQAISIPLWFD